MTEHDRNPTDPTRPPVDLEAIRRECAAVEKRVQEEAERSGLRDPDQDPKPVITDDMVLQALDGNETGDAWLYAVKNRAWLLRVAALDAVCTYDPDAGHWTQDYAGAAIAAVESVAAEYEKTAWRIKNEKSEA